MIKKILGQLNPVQYVYLIGFIVINWVFLLKYSPRLGLNPLLIMALYCFFLILTWIIINYILRQSEIIKKASFLISLIIITVLSIFLIIHIDPLSLEVDRWSALHNFLKYFFAGEYPYLAQTHMGQHASPFPVMHFIAAPFYLMGDVGYLQVFCFILASLVVYKFAGPDKALIFNIILLISPSFWYEIAVRSDLLSNLLLVCVFIFAVLALKPKSEAAHLWITCFSGLLLCTRGISIIPFIAFYGFYLKKLNIQQSVIALFIFGLAFIIPFIPFALWDWKLFLVYNPIFLQTNKTPLVIQITAIIIAIYLAYKLRKEQDIYLISFLILFTIMAATFTMSLISSGYETTIKQHHFDVAYFNVSLPFLAFGFLSERTKSIVV